MRILITGGAGLLGRALIALAPADAELHATQRRAPVSADGVRAHTLDLADAAATSRVWETVRPDLVFHTAYTMDQGERDVWQATRNVAAACEALGGALVHLSSDTVHDGEHAPYADDAEPAPVHDYGRWKARAEAHVRERLPAAAIIRTSLITRLAPPDPRCAWVADSLRRGEPVPLFVDEIRCPIRVEDLAAQLWELAALPAAERAGLWNLAGPEALSRYAIGLLVAAHEGLDPSAILPRLGADHPSPRPRDLRLLTTRADRMLRTRARPLSSVMTDRG